MANRLEVYLDGVYGCFLLHINANISEHRFGPIHSEENPETL